MLNTLRMVVREQEMTRCALILFLIFFVRKLRFLPPSATRNFQENPKSNICAKQGLTWSGKRQNTPSTRDSGEPAWADKRHWGREIRFPPRLTQANLQRKRSKFLPSPLKMVNL